METFNLMSTKAAVINLIGHPVCRLKHLLRSRKLFDFIAYPETRSFGDRNLTTEWPPRGEEQHHALVHHWAHEVFCPPECLVCGRGRPRWQLLVTHAEGAVCIWKGHFNLLLLFEMNMVSCFKRQVGFETHVCLSCCTEACSKKSVFV